MFCPMNWREGDPHKGKKRLGYFKKSAMHCVGFQDDGHAIKWSSLVFVKLLKNFLQSSIEAPKKL
jgi:hypothetical protein